MVQEMGYMLVVKLLKTVERDPIMAYNQPEFKSSVETSLKL